jgi:hypothetical protein
VITGTSTTPELVAATTVAYSVRTAVPGSSWSTEQLITYPAAGASASTGATHHGDAGNGASGNGTTGKGTSGNGTTGEGTTGNGTTGTDPLPEEALGAGEAPAPPPTPAHKIIGANDAAGWGPEFADTLLAGDITWNRVEIGSPYNPLNVSLGYGFHNLAIVGNTPDDAPLSSYSPSGWAETVVSQLQQNPGIAIAEAGNEMYLKGGVANPVQYGQMYLAAVNALTAAGIHTPLLFNMFGDYAEGSWAHATGWSQDAHGGGWLRDAVDGVPGLASAILANGLSSHPYGALRENSGDYSGVLAIPAQEGVARAVLGATPPIYITEFGYNLANCGAPSGACSQQEQASKMQAAYKAFLADPAVAGIWWYQAHDDGTGDYGFINEDNTTRPAYNVISAFAAEQGQ